MLHMRSLLLVGSALALLACSPAAPSGSHASGGNGIDLSPRFAARPAGGVQGLLDRIPAAATATALEDLAAHATPGGPPIPVAGEPNAITKGRELVVLGQPIDVGGTPWLRVYVLPNQNGGATDFLSWIPATDQGRALVSPPQVPTCPSSRENLSALGKLDPFTLARCQGSRTFTLEGRTGVGTLPVWYEVDPNWLGPWRHGPGSTIALRPVTRGWLEVRLPPGLEVPPTDITVRLDAHIADRDSATCRRSDPEQWMPIESAADSRLWCSVQVVVERWEPVLGSEGRPFDASDPQLHRRAMTGTACLGVGGQPLTARIDPTQLEPVWLEGSDDTRVAIWFPRAFRFAFTPEPVVVDGSGRVVVRNGQVIDPDAGLAGHFLCYTGPSLSVD
jgi:hypothetical protein